VCLAPSDTRHDLLTSNISKPSLIDLDDDDRHY
jgi:hypothetical protein